MIRNTLLFCLGFFLISMGYLVAGDSMGGSDISRPDLLDDFSNDTDLDFEQYMQSKKPLDMEQWIQVGDDADELSVRINGHSSLVLRKKEAVRGCLAREKTKYNIANLIHCTADRNRLINSCNHVLRKWGLFDVGNHVDFYALSEDGKQIAALVGNDYIQVIPTISTEKGLYFSLAYYKENQGCKKIDTRSEWIDAKLNGYCSEVVYGMGRGMIKKSPIEIRNAPYFYKLVQHVAVNNTGSKVAFCNNHQVFVGTKQGLECVHVAQQHTGKYKDMMEEPFHFADYLAFNKEGTQLGVFVSAMYDAYPEDDDPSITSSDTWNRKVFANLYTKHKDCFVDGELKKISQLLNEKKLSLGKMRKFFKVLYDDNRIKRRMMVVSL